MVASSSPPNVRYGALPPWLRELDFVTDGFTWLFRLLSRGAEPLMTLSTIYVIIEAGVPAVSLPWLHAITVAIMVSAPEIILPGGFILAGEIKAQGNRRAWMLYGMCWLFVVLTCFTLADLFIWHFTGGAFAALMWGRCAAAVGYSILFRVITERREREVMPLVDATRLMEDHVRLLAGSLAKQLEESEATIAQDVHRMAAQFQGEMQTISAQLLPLMSLVESLHILEAISPENESESGAELSEAEEPETAPEARAAREPGRKYSLTFEEVSARTGLSMLQLKRRAKSGEIEVTSSGKIRVKSLQNLRSNRPTKTRMAQRKAAGKPALALVKKEVVNE